MGGLQDGVLPPVPAGCLPLEVSSSPSGSGDGTQRLPVVAEMEGIGYLQIQKSGSLSLVSPDQYRNFADRLVFQFKFYRLFVTDPVTGYNLIGMTK
ncbi:hypothetical protein D3C78_1459620 [compost metagenome]